VASQRAAVADRIAQLTPRELEVMKLLAVGRPCYEDGLGAQVAAAKSKRPADVRALLNRGETWVVGPA
jgi:FixJ family two-component response regulator